jgi:hypothetical protein
MSYSRYVLPRTFMQLLSIFLEYYKLLNCRAIPLHTWTGQRGSRILRLPECLDFDTWRWLGCQPYAPTAFIPRRYPWHSFPLETKSTPTPLSSRKDQVDGSIGKGNRDLPACRAVPQPTAPLRTPSSKLIRIFLVEWSRPIFVTASAGIGRERR